jgi:Holliday junction resolvase
VPNRNYQNGAALEREWVEDRRREGYVASRAPGSKGSFDAFAAKAGELVLAQMKYGAGSAFSGFGPEARSRLLQDAARAGAQPLLIRKRPRQRGYDTYGPDEWPD